MPMCEGEMVHEVAGLLLSGTSCFIVAFNLDCADKRVSEVWALLRPDLGVYRRSRRRITLHNGADLTVFSRNNVEEGTRGHLDRRTFFWVERPDRVDLYEDIEDWPFFPFVPGEDRNLQRRSLQPEPIALNILDRYERVLLGMILYQLPD